ncbi:hypothetical protein BDF22DRAFT_672789 [Syncephalis plumigaleata]|nr:hypothetical protein BDF22DRAFT_672789 [Syncephalis plumigaleata]
MICSIFPSKITNTSAKDTSCQQLTELSSSSSSHRRFTLNKLVLHFSLSTVVLYSSILCLLLLSAIPTSSLKVLTRQRSSLGIAYGLKPNTAPKSDIATNTNTNAPSSQSSQSSPSSQSSQSNSTDGKHGPVCFQATNPFNPCERVRVPCKMEVTPPVARVAGGRNLKSASGAAAKPSFSIEMTCLDNNNNICKKAKNAFDLASRIMSNVLILDVPLVVNATLLDFCKRKQECDTKHQLLGKGLAARTMLLKDSDGISRVYPQSLIKQMPSKTHPSYDKYDIIAQFNSNASFWFDGDGPIKPSQSDFLFVAVHEMIHGLGFTTSWNEYINLEPTALTPNPLPENAVNDPAAPFQFSGFYESAFDRYLVELPSLQPIPQITNKLNHFDQGIGKVYNNQQEFMDALTRAPEYKLAQYMLNVSVTHGMLGFMPKEGKTKEDVISRIYFASSIAHVSYKDYTKSSDFLMRYLQDPGTLLKDDIEKSGNYINKNPVHITMEMNATSNTGANTLTCMILTTVSWTALITIVIGFVNVSGNSDDVISIGSFPKL